MKSKNLTKALPLIVVALIALYTVIHSPRFVQFRAVDVVLLLAVGLCLGVALSLLLLRQKA